MVLCYLHNVRIIHDVSCAIMCEMRFGANENTCAERFWISPDAKYAKMCNFKCVRVQNCARKKFCAELYRKKMKCKIVQEKN